MTRTYQPLGDTAEGLFLPGMGYPSCMVHHGSFDLEQLHAAARLALRGRGRVEPNPCVGCVIVDDSGTRVGRGHHQRIGGPHAEINAINEAGPRARGATLYVTLEPCSHHGKTPPCTEAIRRAGIRRVVIAQRDPHHGHDGGADELRSGGIDVRFDDSCDLANDVSAPFRHRVISGRPWVIAKWAQTLDGKVATRTGESRWISNSISRRMVHRLRSRVDVILTGVGTVVADDPLLTARDVPIRRVAARVVVDPTLRTPRSSRLVGSARETKTIVACSTDASNSDSARALSEAGVEVVSLPSREFGLCLDSLLQFLQTQLEATNVLVEAGPGLLGRLFSQRLVNEAMVFIAPRLMGDCGALDCVEGIIAPSMSDATALTLRRLRRRGDDLCAWYSPWIQK